MANRLDGTNPLSYQGVTPYSPPEFVSHPRDPTLNDWQNFNLGTIWLNNSNSISPLTARPVWILVALNSNQGTWIQLSAGGGGAVTSLRADDNNIAMPLAGIINVHGTSVLTTTAAIANQLAVNLTASLNGQVIIGDTGGNPAWATLTAGAGITITNAANSITITNSGGGGGSGAIILKTDVNSPATIAVLDNSFTLVGEGANTRITTTAGAGATASFVTFDITGSNNHAVQVGTGGNGLRSIAVGDINQVLLGQHLADPIWGTVPNGALTNSTITLNNGNNVTVTVTGGGQVVALGGTASFAVTGTTLHAVQVGGAVGALNSIAVGDINQVLLGQHLADPIWGTVPNAALTNSTITLNNGQNINITPNVAGVATIALGGAATIAFTGILPIVNGGTNNASNNVGGNTAYVTNGVFYYDGTRFQTTNAGVAGQVLTSNGLGVAPTYQAGGGGGGAVAQVHPGENINISGPLANPVVNLNEVIRLPDTSADGNHGILYMGAVWNAGTATFTTPGDIFLHDYSPTGTASGNVFLGDMAGNLTLVGAAVSNSGVGQSVLSSLTTGADNSSLGAQSSRSITTGSNNAALGFQALMTATSGATNTAIGSTAMASATTGSNNSAVGSAVMHALTTGAGNSAMGAGTLNNLLTGSNNIAIGTAGIPAGSAYVGAESSNIVIGSPGSLGDNNTIRVGVTGGGVGQQNRAFMAGTYGVTPPGGGIQFMVMDMNGQMGTTAGTPASTPPQYAVGTFTPRILFNGGDVGITYTNQTGVYVIVGNLIFIKISMAFSGTTGGSALKVATISGLPFAKSMLQQCRQTGPLFGVNNVATADFANGRSDEFPFALMNAGDQILNLYVTDFIKTGPGTVDSNVMYQNNFIFPNAGATKSFNIDMWYTLPS